MLTLAFTARAAATARLVARALSEPLSAAQWLPGFESWREPPPALFVPNNTLAFRARQHGVPLSGELRVLGITPGRLRVELRVGLLEFTASFSIAPAPDDAKATRVGLALSIESEVPLVGGSLDRFSVREQASQLAESMLAALTATAEKLQTAPG